MLFLHLLISVVHAQQSVEFTQNGVKDIKHPASESFVEKSCWRERLREDGQTGSS